MALIARPPNTSLKPTRLAGEKWELVLAAELLESTMRRLSMREHISLASINQLLGEDLKDGNRASQIFRAFITQPKWQYENFEAWIQEAITQKLPKHLQDVVVALGQHLGFQVEFGRYSQSFDGVWKKATGEHIVLEVKSGTWIAHDIGQLGEYLQEIKAKEAIPDEKVFGLYVVGAGETTPLADQIRGSSWRDRIRLISCADLLSLLKLKVELSSLELKDVDQKIQSILLPIDTIDVGHLVRVIIEIAALRRSLPSEEEEETPTIAGQGAWTREEIHQFLSDSTPTQRALFKVLARQGGKISRRKLIEELQAETGNAQITGLQLAGARGGITMRADRLGKEPLILVSERGHVYELHPDYINDVKSYFGI